MTRRTYRLRLLSIAFAAIVAACAQEADQAATDKASPSKPAMASTEPGIPSAASDAENLVPDPTFSDLEGHWQIIFSDTVNVRRYARETVDLPTGHSVSALRVTTDGGCRVRQRVPTPTDPQETYRFSLWMKQDLAPVGTGRRYFGLFPCDRAGEFLPAIARDGKEEPNPYFWTGNLPEGEWRELVGYLMPSGESAEWPAPGDSATKNFRSPPTMQSCILRFLNYYNRGQTVTTWFALPRIENASR